MKNIKVSNILKVLVVLLVVATTLITKAPQTANTHTESDISGTSTAIEKFKSLLIPGEDSPSANRVATVAIVYPKHANDIDPCTKETNDKGETITDVFVEGDTPLFCGMDRTQINYLMGTYYDKEKFCECEIDFCGSTPETIKFIECLKKTERS